MQAKTIIQVQCAGEALLLRMFLGLWSCDTKGCDTARRKGGLGRTTEHRSCETARLLTQSHSTVLRDW